ncbi:MAG: hypothetical protein NTW30_02735 [Candidatus Aenigmarchaeota archaeon]|nr:hypothetical protein [Candidatus Aenigmarchaeota archaeon]
MEVMIHYKGTKPYLIEGRCYINPDCYSRSDINWIEQMLSIAGQRAVCPGEVSCHLELELEGDITVKNSTCEGRNLSVRKKTYRMFVL